MMRLSQAARMIGGELRGADAEFRAVSTDTRTLPEHALFVALKGERFDGREFLAQAAARRAAGALVEAHAGAAAAESGAALPVIVVPDSRLALGRLAACWRDRFDIPLVAVTGSNGKTTVKEMLSSILRAAFDEEEVAGAETRVLATRGNLNNDIGVPLTLLELRSRHRCAVIEMGMNHAGELTYLVRIARPTVALVTNAGMAHREFFDSEEGIARAKGEVFEALSADGTAVINADDRYAPLWRGLAAGRRRVEFGLAQPAQVSASCELRAFDSEIVLKTPHGEASVNLPAPGRHNVLNALAASAAALALEVRVADIGRGLARYGGVKGRMQRATARGGALLVDDTYNANPDSAAAAIAALARMPGRKLLVLGDMGELGAGAAALHAATGERARSAGIDAVYCLGALSRETAAAFGAGARHYEAIEPLIADLAAALAPGVTVLVKGSRFMRMERVVDALRAGPEAGGGRREVEGR